MIESLRVKRECAPNRKRPLAARVSSIGLEAMLLLFCLMLGGCGGAQSALDPAGPQSGRISQIWWLMFWVCSAVFVAVMAALLYSIFRSRPDPKPVVTQEGDRKMGRVIAGAVGVTTVILFVFLIASYSVGRKLSFSPDPQPLTIKVTAYQWWWDVQYQDPIASNTVITANEIHIPVGKPVILKLTSRDVIHSFWVPNLHGKRDMIPGQEASIWLQSDREGVFRGQCAEFCGHQHAHMAFIVVAEPQESFQAWLEQQRLPAPEPSDPQRARGREVFLSSPCVMCHTIRGTPAGGKVAPDLTHVASRQSIAAATLPMSRDHLANWIADSQQIKPGNKMPPNNLNAEDMQALVAYIESLK